ncbi:MAG: anti-sigma factor [Chitinophagales bacterium]|nr:anti-sigma factor [Chitinophagales bacterium]
MDLGIYISSGVLENYVLGSVSDQERREVECLSSIYPEIKEELIRLQQTMEGFAMANALEPPPGLKASILEAIDGVEQETGREDENKELKVIHRAPEATGRSIPAYWRTAAAASIILLIGAIFLWQSTIGELNNTRTQLSDLTNSKQNLENRIAELESENEESEYLNTLLADNATKRVAMPGTDNSPESFVSVFWNTESEEVFLKVTDLPVPTEDKQYQLWAIVEGQPQDMGVFELDLASESLQAMPYKVKNADAFAITLEPKGGSESPTLSAMYVLGNA